MGRGMAGAITLASGKKYSGELVAIGEPARRSPVADSARPATAPPRRPQSTHVHIHGTMPATARDQGVVHSRDPAPGSVCATFAQSGQTGIWRGTDVAGHPLILKRAEDGTAYELRYATPAELEDPDPDTILATPFGDAGAEDPDTAAMKSAPSRDAGPAGLRGYARLLAEHYKRPA
jgi:hypothetical protein